MDECLDLEHQNKMNYHQYGTSKEMKIETLQFGEFYENFIQVQGRVLIFG